MKNNGIRQVLQKSFARARGVTQQFRPAPVRGGADSAPAPQSIEDLLRELEVPFEITPSGIIALGNVNLSDRGLTQLPDMTNVTVQGVFSCSRNQLTDLQGSPQQVSGSYFCDRNRLRNLRGAPDTINQSFNCNANPQLESLRGGPRTVRVNFVCENNPNLKDLDGAPDTFEKVMSDFGTFDIAKGIPDHVLQPPHVRAAREAEKLVHSKRIRAATTVIAATEISVQIPKLKIPSARR